MGSCFSTSASLSAPTPSSASTGKCPSLPQYDFVKVRHGFPEEKSQASLTQRTPSLPCQASARTRMGRSVSKSYPKLPSNSPSIGYIEAYRNGYYSSHPDKTRPPWGSNLNWEEQVAIGYKWTALSLDYGEEMPEDLRQQMYFELSEGRGKSEEEYRQYKEKL